MLPEMDPEVAKKALDQFPNYISFAKQTLGELKDSAVKAMEIASDICVFTNNNYVIEEV